MDLTEAVTTQLLSALPQLAEGALKCLHFNMGDGVQPVLQQNRLTTSMARATVAKMMAKEALGQTMFTFFKVCKNASALIHVLLCVKHVSLCNTRRQ